MQPALKNRGSLSGFLLWGGLHNSISLEKEFQEQKEVTCVHE